MMNADDTKDVNVTHDVGEDVEGMGDASGSLSHYPIDEVLIRKENRTVHDIIRRIDQKRYVMDPDFQRDLVWDLSRQSRLIESVIMRIPLPVFYLAEDNEGRMIVVDGLQRLSTFWRFCKDELRLRLPKRKDLNNKLFSELTPKIQNRIEDCNLTLYLIDSKVPERALLDIFERVNSGVPLTRQQMRNSLCSGEGTRFLKQEAESDLFIKATGKSLRSDRMRDREFVNRFCAFKLLALDEYKGDMDEWLAACLRKMNDMMPEELNELSDDFRLALGNNFLLFGSHAFRKSMNETLRVKGKRTAINASLWDVLTTGLSRYDEARVEERKEPLERAILKLLEDTEFSDAISIGTNHRKKVRSRFRMAHDRIREVMDDRAD